MTRPGLTAGALGPSIVSLNTNKSSSSSSSSPRAGYCVFFGETLISEITVFLITFGRVSNYGSGSHIYFFWQKSSVELIMIGSWPVLRGSPSTNFQLYRHSLLCTYCTNSRSRTNALDKTKITPTKGGAFSYPIARASWRPLRSGSYFISPWKLILSEFRYNRFCSGSWQPMKCLEVGTRRHGGCRICHCRGRAG